MTVRFDDGGEDERLAPVVPLFGAPHPRTRERSVPEDDTSSRRWHTTWTGGRDSSGTPASAGRAVVPEAGPSGSAASAVGSASDPDDVRARGERMLLRKLRTRSLSLREARRALADAEIDNAVAEEIVADFEGNGYLDDVRLAEQLLDSALGRKAQGATAIARTLSQRGLDREVIDIVLASMPDDEADRALDFARQRARGMSGLDHDVALRRLHGQLARRGFSGSLAMNAARQALTETDG